MVQEGRVTFGVDIDGRGLANKLTRELHKALRPAMAAANRDINKGWQAQPRNAAGQWMKANKALDTHVKKLGQYHGVMGQVNRIIDRFIARGLVLASTISTWLPAIGALAGAIGVLGGGIGAAVGGIGALTAGIAAMVPVIIGAFTAIKIGFSGLKEGAKAYMAQFEDANKILAAKIGNLMGPMLTAWQEVSTRIKTDFATAMVPTFNNLAALIRAVGPSLSGIGQAFAGIANNVTGVLLALAPQVNTILEGSRTFLAAIGPGIQALTAGFTNMGAAAQKAMPTIGAAFRGAMEQVAASWNQIAASPAFQTALQGFAQIITEVGKLLAGLGPVMVQIGAQVGPIFAQMIGALGPALNQVLTAFGNIAVTVGPIFNQFLAALGPALASVVTGLGQMAQAVGPTLVPLLNALAQALQPLYGPLGQMGAVLAESLVKVLPSLSELVQVVLVPMVNLLPMLGDLLKPVADLLVAVGPLIVSLGDVFGRLFTTLANALPPLLPAIDGLAQALAPVAGIIGDILVFNLKILADILKEVAPYLRDFFLQLRDVFDKLRPQLQEIMQKTLERMPEVLERIGPAMGKFLDAMIRLLDVLTPMLPMLFQMTSMAIPGLALALPVLLGPLGMISAAVENISKVFDGMAIAATRSINTIIGFYNDKLRPILNSVPWLPDAPEISPISYTPVSRPGGGGAPPVVPGAPKPSFSGSGPFNTGGAGSRVGMNNLQPQIPTGWGTPQPVFAPPGPSTPVTPDLGGAQPSAADLLAGGGGPDAPLNAINKGIQAVIEQQKKAGLPKSKLPPGSIPGRIGPFGTPIPARHPGYEAAAAAIQALGGNPEEWIGPNPIAYATQQWEAGLDAMSQRAQNAPTAPGMPGPNLATPANPLPVSIASILHDTGSVASGPQAQRAAALVAQYFPQISNIGGSRDTGAAQNTHQVGRAIDINIPNYGTPQGIALGNQIRDFLQQNAAQLGVVYTIWQDQLTNTGLGGRAPGPGGQVGGHMDHIDVQFANGTSVAMGPGGIVAPGGVPQIGVGGAPVPVFVTNWPGQATGPQGLPPGVGPIIDAGVGAAGQAASTVASDVISAAASVGLEPWTQRQPNATLDQLVQEGNPLALAAAAGLNVQDFTRRGGVAPSEMTQPSGPGFDSSGRLYSDTTALMERTFTSLTAQIQAMREQLLDVLNQVRERLTEQVLLPIMRAAVQEGIEGIKNSVLTAQGQAIGAGAAPALADAVKGGLASSQTPGAGLGANLAGALFASGGPVTGGVPGRDSVPILAQQGEWVLNRRQVSAMGGFAGMAHRLAALGVRGYATGGGVIGNATVGAEWFGVSQVPIIGMIVNLLVRVLLEVIGVQIEVRDTLNEMTGEFRSFREGAFTAFDAQGRLLNDTSGLIDRSLSSEQAVADERIRILKIVIAELVKYIVEKVIVPIAKAVANAAIQAGASAAGAAIDTTAPGAGGIVSSAITAGGQAGVDIVAEIGTDLAKAATDVISDVASQGLKSLFPDLITGIFGGALVEGLMTPIGALLGDLFGGTLQLVAGQVLGDIFGQLFSGGGLLGMLLPTLVGGTGGISGGLIGGLLSLILGLAGGSLGGGFGGFGGGLFDDGGLAVGAGLIPKATNAPELWLSPRETDHFDRLVTALEGGGRNLTIHAPMQVYGGSDTAERVHDRLLALLS